MYAPTIPSKTSPIIVKARVEAAKLNVPRDVWEAFRAQVNNSRRRNIPFLMTFTEWWTWWQEDDRWSRRGMGADAFVMSRYGDLGPYSLENVFCTTHTDNIINMGDASKQARDKKIQDSWDNGRVCHLSGKRENHPKAKAVMTPQGLFGNATLAAEAFGLTRQAAATRVRTGYPGWHYVADLEKLTAREHSGGES